jgi:hypothetical protein
MVLVFLLRERVFFAAFQYRAPRYNRRPPPSAQVRAQSAARLRSAADPQEAEKPATASANDKLHGAKQLPGLQVLRMRKCCRESRSPSSRAPSPNKVHYTW